MTLGDILEDMKMQSIEFMGAEIMNGGKLTHHLCEECGCSFEERELHFLYDDRYLCESCFIKEVQYDVQLDPVDFAKHFSAEVL